MKKGHLKRACLTAVLFGLALGFGCSKEEEKPQPKTFEDVIEEVVVKPEPVKEAVEARDRALKVGVIGPETGEGAEIGLMTFKGVKTAAEAFNSSGGIEGKNIEIILIDNKGQQAATTEAMEEFISGNVAAVIGAPTGWATFTPVHIANESETVFISAGTRRHIGRSGPFVFRFTLPGQKAADELIDYCVNEAGMKNFGLITVMEDEALNVSSFFRIAVQKWGAEVKAEGHIFSDDDIAQAVSDIKEKLPIDAVIFAGSSASALAFVEEAGRQDLKLPLVGGEELYSKDFLKGGRAVQGSIVYSGFSPIDTTPHTKGFVDSYRKMNGRLPTIFAAEAYDAFMLVASVIKNSGSTRPETIRSTIMDTKDFQGVTGVIGMDDRGEVVRRPYLLKVVKDGKGVSFSIVRTPHGKKQ